MPVKEQETNGRMEVCRQEPVSEEEGANTSKTPAKEPPSMPQYSGKKKARRKKKKKKKKKAVQGNGKHPGKSKKQPIFGMSPLRLLQPQSDDVTLQDEATKVTPGQTVRDPLFASTSTISFLSHGSSDPTNDSLRWDGILDDPVAEEARLWNYRVNRRKRYGAYIQQSLPPEPSFALRRLPQLCKVSQMNGERLLSKSKSSTTTLEADEDESRLLRP